LQNTKLYFAPFPICCLYISIAPIQKTKREKHDSSLLSNKQETL
jgi:hypothetical protein